MPLKYFVFLAVLSNLRPLFKSVSVNEVTIESLLFKSCLIAELTSLTLIPFKNFPSVLDDGYWVLRILLYFYSICFMESVPKITCF